LNLSVPVSIALIASLFVALLVIPLGSYKALGAHPPKEWPLFDRISAFYQRMLGWTLLRRLDLFVFTLLLLGSITIPMRHVQMRMMRSVGRTSFTLRFTFTQNVGHQDRDQYLKKVEAELLKHGQDWGIEHVSVQLKRYGQHAIVQAYLRANGAKMQLSSRNIYKKVMPLIPAAPGVTRRVGWRSVGGGDPTISLHLYGPDSKTLEDIALRLEKHLQTDPAFRDAEADLDRDQLPEMQLRIQRIWAFRNQLPAARVGGNINYALSGRKIRTIRLYDREVAIRLLLREKDRSTLQRLKQLPLQRQSASIVPLQQLIKEQYSTGPRVITHVQRKIYMKLKIAIGKKGVGRMYRKLTQKMASFKMPEGYTWGKGFEFGDMREDDNTRAFAITLSIVFVLLLMGILFESFFHPFSVLLSIPLAFLGVYWLLYLTQTPIDTLASIGMIMLIGLAVNHAIFLVDRINQLREEGFERHLAIVEACGQRLRPILMTSLTTICGLLPMVFGSESAAGISYRAMGLVVIGGLMTSLLLSLFLVPLFYTLLDDLHTHLKQLRMRYDPNTHGAHNAQSGAISPTSTNTPSSPSD
ncbi:MAG: efflux RND transporter permease subunit, partial [Myxococcota bacterium]